MKKTESLVEMNGKVILHVWTPEGDVRHLLQICHGLSEYLERYDGFAEEMVKKYGAHIAVGADVKNGEIATHGWTKTTGTGIDAFMKMMENMGVATVICTDVSRDGALMGTNMELYRGLTAKYGVGIIASGGITELSEVFTLAEMGVYGAILGKAIYNGNIDLREAVKAEAI